jgi:hypothetical protein
MNGNIICPKCKVFVKNLSKHLERNRCEAVKERRLFRKENKESKATVGNFSKSIGVRGDRTDKRKGIVKKDKKLGVDLNEDV